MILLEGFWEGTKLDPCVQFDIFTQKPEIRAEAIAVGTGTAVDADKWNRIKIPGTDPISEKSPISDNGSIDRVLEKIK